MNKIFYIIYCILVYVEYVPRTVKLIRTESSADYSLGSVVLSFVGMICWAIYLFTTDQDLILYIGCFIDILMSLFFLVLVFKYHKKGERNIGEDISNR